jgi:hypothetical protein
MAFEKIFGEVCSLPWRGGTARIMLDQIVMSLGERPVEGTVSLNLLLLFQADEGAGWRPLEDPIEWETNPPEDAHLQLPTVGLQYVGKRMVEPTTIDRSWSRAVENYGAPYEVLPNGLQLTLRVLSR